MKGIKRLLLIILDGWGIGDKTKSDAIFNAETPYFDHLTGNYPSSELFTSGESVGLPDGQMGNSEVGHLNIGAGRKIYHDLVKINKAIETDEIAQNEKLIEAFTYARDHKKELHFIGLVSNGGVHSSNKHLYKLCELTNDYKLDDVFIHAITDGRDTDPKSGYGFMKELIESTKGSKARVASLIGRYYSMDRDQRWDRIKIGYNLMVKGIGRNTHNLLAEIKQSYQQGITDEFIKPIVVIDDNQHPIGCISEEDVVICFNFRTDRLRQMTMALTQKDIPEHGLRKLNLNYFTMSNYDKNFKKINVIFDKENVGNTLGELLAENGKSQLRIAETEKYAHVTYFFSGGREELFENENRIMVPSPKVSTYDHQPEMSAPEVTEKLVAELKKKKHDFICLNYANGDMVGHTGVYKAILQAVRTVDSCLKETVETAIENNYSVIITADHGNADNVINENQSPNTAHSLNPVPCIIIGEGDRKIKDGILADLAPTILKIMGIKQAEEMTGSSLI
ncbi:MAG: 2,3-bisphosphoglycerate-independent phosphoglycerate mutase [Bacteroidetes bacterium]|nr:2,3-bisphosphoglycerate-independent phosphoglycerate mutase [Bacteroidota bacterium]